jgi:integrase
VAAKRGRPPRPTTSPPPSPVPRMLQDLLDSFLSTVAPSSHPARRSTLRKVALLISGQPDPGQVPIEACRGLLKRWEDHVAQQVEQEKISSASARQYCSQIKKLVEWSLTNLNRPARGKQAKILDHLSQLNAAEYALLDWLGEREHHKERRGLRRLLLYMEEQGHTLNDLYEDGMKITQVFAGYLKGQNLNAATWKGYFWEANKGIRLLQEADILPEFELYNLNTSPAYKIPWENIPNNDLREKAARFHRLACDGSMQKTAEWLWKPVKSITRDLTLGMVERFVGWQIHYLRADLAEDSIETIFSRERLKGYWIFYGERPGRGRNSVFEALQVFAERALDLPGDELFRQFIDPKRQARPRAEKRRSVQQWLTIERAVEQAIQSTINPAEQLSLERFLLFFKIILASLLRIDSLIESLVDHLQREAGHYVLLIPPEHLKKTKRPNDTWRRVLLPEPLTDAIEHYLHKVRPKIAKCSRSTFLFPVSSAQAQPVSRQFLTRQLKKFDQLAHGVPREQTTSFHMLRNTATVDLIRKKDVRGAYFASKALGHTNTDTTRKHYTDVHGALLVRRDWQLRELIDKEDLSDQHIRDIMEMLKREKSEWEIVLGAIEKGGD